MSFAIVGAQRSGKSTLAKKIAELRNWHYHDASVTEIMKEYGVNGVGNLSIEDRIGAQEFLLTRFIEKLRAAPRPLITDRTPIDMIGYALGEVTMHNTDEATGLRIHNYVERCLEETRKNFDTIVLVRPLPTYTPDPKSPPPNRGYQTQIQMIIEGALMHVSDDLIVVPVFSTDFQERVDDALYELDRRMNEYVRAAKYLSLH